jgi:hypothetical protein
MGFGNFSSLGETDMMLRNVNTGEIEVCDIKNNQITSVPSLGTVGLNWQFSGVGNFSSLGESDMLLRNSNTGGLEVYDIANNQITNAAFIGTVGVDWQFSGVGNFSGNPAKPISSCAAARPAGLKSTTLPTINSPARPSSVRWVWIGNSPALRRSTPPARPTWCCGTSIRARSRSTTLRATPLSGPRAWARSVWIGSLAASPPILRAARLMTQVKSVNSCKRWQVLTAAETPPMA